jgi:hypothetical protein
VIRVALVTTTSTFPLDGTATRSRAEAVRPGSKLSVSLPAMFSPTGATRSEPLAVWPVAMMWTATAPTCPAAGSPSLPATVTVCRPPSES